QIDIIYVEWHFFGLFSYSERTVKHVLAKKAYKRRFENELHARNIGRKFKRLSQVFPKLLEVSINPKFYVEELAVDSGNQLVGNKQLIKAQKVLKKLNRKTLKTVAIDDYYRKLQKQL